MSFRPFLLILFFRTVVTLDAPQQPKLGLEERFDLKSTVYHSIAFQKLLLCEVTRDLEPTAEVMATLVYSNGGNVVTLTCKECCEFYFVSGCIF